MKTLIPLLLLLVACSPSKRAHKYFAENREEFATDCAEAFPVKDSVVVKDSTSYDTLYLENEVLRDTIYVDGQPIYLDKKCPQSSVITKTVRRDSIIIRRDIAYETQQRQQITALRSDTIKLHQVIVTKDAEISEAKHSRNKWRKWCLITWGIIALYVGLKIFSSRLPFKI